MTPRPRACRPATATVLRCLALLASGCALPAWADCTVSTSGVVFGAYDTLSPLALDGAGTISVSCNPAAPYSIALSPGGGSYALRRMVSGSDQLEYNLFTDSTRTMVWGDGSGGTTAVSGNADSASHTVYGRIPGGQNVRAGSYSDSLVVTLTF
jgi:spore coat protein U-like protein